MEPNSTDVSSFSCGHASLNSHLIITHHPSQWDCDTCYGVDAALVENAVEELEPHDGEDDDEEHDEQHDVEERDHRHDDRVDHNL